MTGKDVLDNFDAVKEEVTKLEKEALDVVTDEILTVLKEMSDTMSETWENNLIAFIKTVPGNYGLEFWMKKLIMIPKCLSTPSNKNTGFLAHQDLETHFGLTYN